MFDRRKLNCSPVSKDVMPLSHYLLSLTASSSCTELSEEPRKRGMWKTAVQMQQKTTIWSRAGEEQCFLAKNSTSSDGLPVGPKCNTQVPRQCSPLVRGYGMRLRVQASWRNEAETSAWTWDSTWAASPQKRKLEGSIHWKERLQAAHASLASQGKERSLRSKGDDCMDLGSNLHCVCAVWEPTPWGKKKKKA